MKHRSTLAQLRFGWLLWLALAFSATGLSAKEAGFSHFSLALPGIPAAMIPAEVNGDDLQDLAVVVAYTDWEDVTTVEETHFDGIEGMVEVMNIVSSLIDHRELRIYPGLAEGGYGSALPPLELDTSIHALAAGHPSLPLVAITDSGVAAVRFEASNQAAPLSIETLVEQPNLYTESRIFYPDLDFLVDLNDDEIPEVLLATTENWVVFRGTPAGFAAAPLPVPSRSEADSDAEGEESTKRSVRRRRHGRRVPTVRDLNGDGSPELVLVSHSGERGALVYPNRGDLHFDEPIDYGRQEDTFDSADHAPLEEFVYLGPLVEAGPAVAVTRTEVERYGDDATMRQEIDQAKRPLHAYALNAIKPTLDLGDRVGQFEAIGYTFEGTDDEDDDDDDGDDIQIRLPSGFQDLDGDGREDLVSITLQFSILGLVSRALLTQSISLKMDFHTWCQQDDGTFRETENLDLSGKFKISFRSNTLRHLSQFAGDFNGDGRADFVQLGRGKKVTIHHGQPNCDYPAEPDGVIRFKHKLLHLGFVRVLDLNLDGRSDLYVVHPLKKPKKGESTPVVVDVYLSD